MDYKEKIADLFRIAREEGAIKKWADGVSDAEEALSTRQDCERCNGKGSWVKEDDACNAVGDPCDNCDGTGEAGLSLGEVWELYQQGKLVELDDDQTLPEYTNYQPAS